MIDTSFFHVTVVFLIKWWPDDAFSAPNASKSNLSIYSSIYSEVQKCDMSCWFICGFFWVLMDRSPGARGWYYLRRLPFVLIHWCFWGLWLIIRACHSWLTFAFLHCSESSYFCFFLFFTTTLLLNTQSYANYCLNYLHMQVFFFNLYIYICCYCCNKRLYLFIYFFIYFLLNLGCNLSG